MPSNITPTPETHDATPLRSGLFAIRPKDALGTCGWIKDRPWTVIYTKNRKSIPLRKD